MTTREITLDQNSDDGLYTRLLRGRYVTSIENEVITLDDGTAGGGVLGHKHHACRPAY